MDEREKKVLTDFASGLGKVIEKSNALRNALDSYDAWKAEDERRYAEYKRTGDWRTYEEWLNNS